MVETDSSVVVAPEKDNSPYRIHVRFSSPGPRVLIINQFYFPGWRVILNGRSVTDQKLGEWILGDGCMRVVVGPGRDQELLAYYDGPPLRKIRTGIAFGIGGLALLVLFALMGAPVRRARPCPA